MRKNPRRILSPQRLPFRHPGTGSMEKVACMGAALNVGGEGGEAGASIGGGFAGEFL